jgi:long-chain acyl-CoA synthetase
MNNDSVRSTRRKLSRPGEREHHGIMTVVGMVEYAVSQWSDLVAYRIRRGDGYEEWTYGEFYNKVHDLAAGLVELGIKPGDRVGVVGENRPEWVAAYIAIQRAGGVTVPLDALLKTHEFLHIIHHSELKAVVTSGRLIPEMREVQDSLDTPLTIISMDDDPPESVMAMKSVMTADHPAEWPTVTLDDLAVLIYTSGTTGSSKGVMLTHGNLGSDVAHTAQIVYFGPGDGMLSVLPLHHTFEATCTFLCSLYGRLTVTFATSLKSRELLEDFKNSGANFLVTVPLLLEKIMQGITRKISKEPAYKRSIISLLFGIEKFTGLFGRRWGRFLFTGLRKKAGLDALTYIVVGGAALLPHVQRWYRALGFRVMQGYGLTETSPITNGNRWWNSDLYSVGPPLPTAENRILNPDSEGIGEILVRGPMVMQGYYKNPDLTAEVIDEDGWFHTGDLGRIDKRGRLSITGRSKDVIVTPNGKNVYPEEIEALIVRCRYVMECLVLGESLPDTTSEEVHAHIVPDYEEFEREAGETGKSFSQDEIEALVRIEVESIVKDITEYKRPRKLFIRQEEFVKTSSRKIKRYLYRQKQISLGDAPSERT